MSVYESVVKMLKKEPQEAHNLTVLDLKPIVEGQLLPPALHRQISAIYNNKSLVLRVRTGGQSTIHDMSTEELGHVVRYCDEIYYDAQLNGETLPDALYDQVKRVWNARRFQTNDKEVTMRSSDPTTGTGFAKPSRSRDAALPFSLKSLGNLFMGEGDVEKYRSKHSGPYWLSAKMDGTSALLHNGRLYTRGNAIYGRDISHVAKLLNLPRVLYGVRGELVMRKDVFDTKYKGKNGRNVNRNAVAGALGSINNIDKAFISDMSFVAYEMIVSKDGVHLPPSKQFEALKGDGFTVPWCQGVATIDDTSLSGHLRQLYDQYEYVVDGVVVALDKEYSRSNSSSKNPDYARSFKEPLKNDMAVTTVKEVQWEPSQYGYLCPTVVFEPVRIDNVVIQRATAHNARDVEAKGLGPGAVIEVIYWGKVNPRVNNVLQKSPSGPQFPSAPWKWQTNDKGEKVNVVLDTVQQAESESDQYIDTVNIKKIHRFLVEISAKGIGEQMVRKIYTQNPIMRSIGAFMRMQPADVRFLGPTLCEKVVSSIQTALNKVDYATLMAASKQFGRGLGSTKFAKVLDAYPDLPYRLEEWVQNQDQLTERLKGVEGFAGKTATLAAGGMVKFVSFLKQDVPPHILDQVLRNSVQEPELSVSKAHPEVVSRSFCLTGFRSLPISEFIARNGGKVVSTCTKGTNYVIRKDQSYTNKKVEFAFANNVPVLSEHEFKEKFSFQP